MQQFEWDALPTAPPNDDLQAILAPLQTMGDADLDAMDLEPAAREQFTPVELLEFHRDGTPTWWPLNRDPNGQNWTLAERRTVLLQRIRETLHEVSPKLVSTRTGQRQLVRTLHRIACGVRSQASDILSL